MRLTFDYYHNLEEVELRLCNPDGRELFPLPGKNRELTLRFNDLSELTFEVDSKITLSDGTVVNLEAYDYIQTKRLVYATNIGWFQISNVDEHDNGIVKYKTVTAESYQAIFKNKGFLSEERVYCFYNPNDPQDERYESSKENSIPSVVGQWYRQLGVELDLAQGLDEPLSPYDVWTVTYINEDLIYNGEGSVCRTFKENTTFGYDWMVNDVEDAFEVVVLFDFMYKAIQVKSPREITEEKANVIYTFNNFMKNVEVTEKSEDIITVLNCNGDNCDITSVNPTGTNYICDFSYYMDELNYRWMSADLIKKLKDWKKECKDEKGNYTNLTQELRDYWKRHTELKTELQEMSLSLQDLKNAQAKRSVVGKGEPRKLSGKVIAEVVKVGNRSIKSGTDYYSANFTGETEVTAYLSPPEYSDEGKWVFNDSDCKTASADEIIRYNLSIDDDSDPYWYFSDVSDGSSYCKLISKTSVNKDSETNDYYCDGFERYIAYCYPETLTDEATNTTYISYTDNLQEWIDLREYLVSGLNSEIDTCNQRIDYASGKLDLISSKLNILSYFASTPRLLRELNCYWIEGDYTNENIAVLENTTPEEEIDLCNELLDSGYKELSKVCQPRFSFSLESIDVTRQYEFREQMHSLELGKIITIEKEEGLWYYPALLEISINLDNSEDFTMTFANATRLDDWGYTYADLISDSSSTSRKIGANWQNFLAYSKEKEEISSLIKDPLDTTLRAAFANMVNQEFTVDKNGILGRKKTAENSAEFEKEQVRLINNVLIFTDDNWETAKTALGKIYYTNDEGKQVTSYGLIAETIIGSLIMGESLKIKNKENTISIDKNGILIKGLVSREENETVTSEWVTMFEADASNGKLYVREAEITGNIVGGSINIANNFIVDNNGNVALNGSITWGTQNSPTQIVYSRTSLTKPADETKWSSFPETSDTNWHQKYNANDYFASYTYDGGNTWTNAIQIAGKDGKDGQDGKDGKDGTNGKNGTNGEDGSTIEIVYLYKSKKTSTAPSEPDYQGYGDPDNGWTLTPQDASASKPYVFVSQSTVIDGEYGEWSTPVCWAKYGSDATVTDINVFNALTNNGEIYGCFTALDGKLYINAAYIQTGQIDADLTITGELIADNAHITGEIDATSGKIGGWAIEDKKIYSGESGRVTVVQSADESYGALWVFAAGGSSHKSYEDCPFRVSPEGVLHATEAHITGEITATSGYIEGKLKFGGNDSYYIDANKNDESYYIKLPGFEVDDASGVVFTGKLNNSGLRVGEDGGFTITPYNSGYGLRGCALEYENNGNLTGYIRLYQGSQGAEIYIYSRRYMSFEATTGYMFGSWYLDAGNAVTSDSSLKHDVSELSNEYSVFFENLRPVTFKYNNGTSGRLHTGFIAQEVYEALQAANVSTQDFAGYIEQLNKDGTTTCYLRYEEFISLNTWQIQKLKARVSELEAIVAKLQENLI